MQKHFWKVGMLSLFIVSFLVATASAERRYKITLNRGNAGNIDLYGWLTKTEGVIEGTQFTLTNPPRGSFKSSEILSTNDNSVVNDIHLRFQFNFSDPIYTCDLNISLPTKIILRSDGTCIPFKIPGGAAPDTGWVDIAELTPVSVPFLTTYGLIALALLLASTAVWMFRKRKFGVS